MEMIDTHLHLLLVEQGLHYPWAIPKGLTRRFQLADYATDAKACGIANMLHMEVDVAANEIDQETRLIQQLVEDSANGLVGQVAACRPELPNETFYNQLVLLKNSNRTVRGLRRILHQSPDELSRSHVFLGNIQLMSDFNYSFDLVVLARQLRTVAIPLVYQCPEVSFILDHCGNPLIDSQNSDFQREWEENIAILAQFPNLYCKVSGLVSNAPLNWQVEDLQPYFDHIVQCFGYDRLVWGSDWPVCTLNGGLEAWVAASLRLAAQATPTEQRKLFSENAKSIYRI
ncbi:MAG: amidohydrolase family protein [Alphaproteobacteria bacterium]|nr:amidohydrolase family protein [Alphaproteobacteria bacterium]